MNFKSIINWLHLWLGLTSGIVVFIVAITGSIYVFKTEIKDAMEPWRFVAEQEDSYAPPSQLLDSAQVYVPGHKPTGLTYDGKEGAAAVGYWINDGDFRGFNVVFLNPYTAAFIKKQAPLAKGQFNFFEFIESGHRFLWLPEKIGRPIVGVSVLVFLVLLITGLILWWPKNLNKANRKKSFTVKWKTGFQRLNYDLHNVMGFYAALFATVIAITGLVWSFEWFGNGLYYLTSGGENKMEHHHPHSDTTKAKALRNDSVLALDRAFYAALAEEPNPERIYITPHLEDEDDAIEIVFYQQKGKFYQSNEYFFDQYTLAPLRISGDRYGEAGFAKKLEMANYDLHTGAILGMPGKILAFLVSLIIASLPVTGFLVWFKRKQTKRKARKMLLN